MQLLDVIDLGPGGRQAVQAWLPRFEFLLDDLRRAFKADKASDLFEE